MKGKGEGGSAEEHFKRGNTYSEKGRFDRAISEYTKAIEIDPKNSWAYNSLAYVYLVGLSDMAKACKNYIKACELGRCDTYNDLKRKNLCK